MSAVPCRVVVAFVAGLAGPLVAHVAAQPVPPVLETIDPFGKPTGFKAGRESAVGIWYDTYWHVNLTTNKKAKVTFTGSVRADKGKLVGVYDELDKGNKAVAGDLIFPHKDGGGFDFRFTNGGGVDSLRFKLDPAATKVTIAVQLDGVAAPGRVHIGKASKSPTAVPFSLPAHPMK